MYLQLQQMHFWILYEKTRFPNREKDSWLKYTLDFANNKAFSYLNF